MLFSYIYYHQKVLISETMIKDYAYGLYELHIIDSFADFLKFTDSDILKLAEKQKKNNPFPDYGMLDLEELAANIKNRRLPKRCFEVSQASVIPLEEEHFDSAHDRAMDYCREVMRKIKDDAANYTAEDLKNDMLKFSSTVIRDKETLLDSLIKDLRDLTYTEMLEKRQEFFKALVEEYKKRKMNINFTVFDIYIVFPKLVNYGSTTDAVVLGKDPEKLMTVNDFVKLDDWAGSFNSNKWRGYVFVSDKIDMEAAFIVADRLVLKGKAKLKNPMAFLKGLDY